MANTPDTQARRHLSEQGFAHVLTAEVRRIRNRATFFFAGVVLMSTGLVLLGIIPCLYLTKAGDDLARCTGAIAVTLLSGDMVFLRETTGLLLGIFVAMILAVVIMSPRVDVDQAPLEAARGVLAALATASGLVVSILALLWSASAMLQWAAPVSSSAVHLIEIPLGVLSVVFCAFATTVLRPGLGVTVSTIRWARGRLHSLNQWEVSKRRAKARRADGEAVLSLLALVTALAATRPYWEHFSQSRTLQPLLFLFCGLSLVGFVVLVTMKVHFDPDRKAHAAARATVGVATSFYLFAVAAQAIPLWSAAVVSITIAWFLHAASACLAFASYEMPMPRILSLRESVRQKLSRCHEIILENERRLGESTRSRAVSPIKSA